MQARDPISSINRQNVKDAKGRLTQGAVSLDKNLRRVSHLTVMRNGSMLSSLNNIDCNVSEHEEKEIGSLS